MTFTGFKRLLAGCCVVMGLTFGGVASAQGLFTPVIKVNDRVITTYEINQRALLLKALGTRGDLQRQAREQLIEDRLKLDATDRAGIRLTVDEIEDGVAEFASRTRLSPEEFVQGLADEGVSPETFRDFVVASLTWRELIRARFGGRAQITEEEVDRAIGQLNQTGGLRVLLSEIILPARPDLPDEVERSQRLAQELSTIQGIDNFSQAARQYSVVPSRERGGRMEWLDISNLPAPLRPVILALKPGEVSAPIDLAEAVLLFQLRGIEETAAPPPSVAAVEYVQYFIPGGRSADGLAAAAKVASRVDTCDDLYGVAKGQPKEVLQRDALAPSQIPSDIALELAKLDRHEVSTALTRNNGETLVFLMLCGRTADLSLDENREQVRQRLRSQRLASYADGLLAELRADALILQ